MLKAENLSFQIGQKTLIDDVSLTLLPGEFTMVLGPNGAGKSTLLKLLTGTETPKTGQIYYGDQPLPSIPLSTQARQKAVLSQLLSLPFDLSVNEVVMMGRYPYFDLNPTAQDTQIADHCLESVGMLSFKTRAFASLSGGEKQKIHLARVLAQLYRQPGDESVKYLFLDEPISALDIQYQHQILGLVRDLAAKNRVVFVIVHDINLALHYADNVILMDQGRIFAMGIPEQVLTVEAIETVFKIRPYFTTHPETGRRVMIW
ncbi:heme ABC transporter ATP-binding protein [Spirosoma fluviale]|uniref:Iron complex transport system ATP-binding protein n=1 Tax=Spirosoma fluviale TaxID=1597977 RepID=A0A286FBJ2_9BACT|nr:heme ABC transporter ATP-binding protein [Spirosoma fluviale]SOD80597.1 iron complex transport system ATP-binding protein [Spirosoma fluviale]